MIISEGRLEVARTGDILSPSPLTNSPAYAECRQGYRRYDWNSFPLPFTISLLNLGYDYDV